MFNALIASKPVGRRSLTSRTMMTSIAIHALLLAGAGFAATRAPDPREKPLEEVTYLDVQEEPKAPEPKPEEPPPPPEPEEAEPEPQPAPDEPAVLEAPREAPAPEPVAKGFQELAPPTEVPTKLPDVDPNARAVRAEDFSGVGVAGGAATGVTGGEARNTEKEPAKATSSEGDGEGSGPLDVAVVEERPKLINGSEMERALQRAYPALLRDAGITGNAVLRFVIDDDGRVEPGSVSVVSASHDAFGEASVQVANKMRFRPAKVAGRNVRVLISMPIQWQLDR